MAQFDPMMRRETWVFQQIGQDGRGPIWMLADYLFVSYDDDPKRWIEPWPNGEIIVTDGPNGFSLIDPSNRSTDGAGQPGLGRVVGFEFVTKRPYEVHAFNDFDAFNNGTQLPVIPPGSGNRNYDT